MRIFQKSDRLLSDQDEPDYIFPDMEQELRNVNKDGKSFKVNVLKFRFLITSSV